MGRADERERRLHGPGCWPRHRSRSLEGRLAREVRQCGGPPGASPESAAEGIDRHSVVPGGHRPFSRWRPGLAEADRPRSPRPDQAARRCLSGPWRTADRVHAVEALTRECEMIERRSFGTRDGARPEVAHFIEGWYDPHRRHSGLVCESPACLEARARERAADVSARADALGGLRAPQTSGPSTLTSPPDRGSPGSGTTDPHPRRHLT